MHILLKLTLFHKEYILFYVFARYKVNTKWQMEKSCQSDAIFK